MKPEFVRPIPKYIVERIKKLDLKRCPVQISHVRFYSYLTKIKGELVKVTVAVKSRYKKWWHKQVAVHGVKSEQCLVKDMKFHYLGGYSVGFHAEGMYKEPWWYEDGNWYDAEFKYFNPFSILVNQEYVGKFPQYKYSAYQQFRGDCIIKYLRLYEKYPQTEYLVKLGLHGLRDKVTVLKRIVKDKSFCKWLISQQIEIAKSRCYAGAILESYKTGRPLGLVQKMQEFKKTLKNNDCLQTLQKMFGKNLNEFYAYIAKQNTDPFSYIDYLKACKYLRLDMNRPKNRFPSDFKKWHDRRIDEYNTIKKRVEEKQRAELYKQFAAVAEKYLTLQNCKPGAYAVFVARSPAELIREGEQLNHCVGRMNYEQKMVREETLILFIRHIEHPDVPFVTIEYSPKSKRVLQCYGMDSQKPDNNVLTFVNKVWLPYANRTIKKLSA